MKTFQISPTFAGYVPGVAIPFYDKIVEEVLESTVSPWGGGGSTSRVAICGPDGTTIYRVDEVEGLGEWMFLVSGLENAGFINTLKNLTRPDFDAIFIPSPQLLEQQPAMPAPPPSPSEDLGAAAAQLQDLSETERAQVILARQGQGAFRESLLKAFEGRCALTGFSFAPALRASHIKPWRDCSNAERLDVANGLLLRADIDALFDGGFITFGDEGELLIAKSVPETVVFDLRLRPTQRLCPEALSAQRRVYLVHHRARIFQA